MILSTWGVDQGGFVTNKANPSLKDWLNYEIEILMKPFLGYFVYPKLYVPVI